MQFHLDRDALFHKGDLRSALEEHLKAMRRIVEALPEGSIRSTELGPLARELAASESLVGPRLRRDAITQRVERDVSREMPTNPVWRQIRHETTVTLQGVEVTLFVPFDGDPEVFKYRASTYTYNPPHASVTEHELVFTYFTSDSDHNGILKALDDELNNVEKLLEYANADINAHNAGLAAAIEHQLRDRLHRLEAADSLAGSLGFPERASETLAPVASEVRATVHRKRAASITRSGRQEPGKKYDVALSYAAEQREYVERVAEELDRQSLVYFYAPREEWAMWGEDLAVFFQKLFTEDARYVVAFISDDYVRKPYPQWEFKSALAQAMSARSAYILPVRFDDSRLPGLAQTVKFLDARNLEPKDVAAAIVAKLGKRK